MTSRTVHACLCALALFGASAPTHAQCISTQVSNNGTGGCYINLTPMGGDQYLGWNAYQWDWSG